MSKHLFLLLPFAFLLSLPALAGQDLFDFTHSRAYARYLLQSRQYDLAAEEYERLIFMQPANDTLRFDLLRAYRRAGQPKRGLEKWANWQTPDFRPGGLLRAEQARLLLANGHTGEARLLAATPDFLDSSFARRVRFFALTLEQDWPTANVALLDFPAVEKMPRRPDFENLLKKGMAARRKKPWVATGLSLAVPGLGKAYAGQWKDGAISFLFVGLNVWQATRRFDKEGTDTFWGYVHGGLAAGFYVGNLYGSHKAARKHNTLQRQKLQREAEGLVFPILD